MDTSLRIFEGYLRIDVIRLVRVASGTHRISPQMAIELMGRAVQEGPIVPVHGLGQSLQAVPEIGQVGDYLHRRRHVRDLDQEPGEG